MYICIYSAVGLVLGVDLPFDIFILIDFVQFRSIYGIAIGTKSANFCNLLVV